MSELNNGKKPAEQDNIIFEIIPFTSYYVFLLTDTNRNESRDLCHSC